ncbi:MAG: glycosyltransferase family 2 protein [Phycisphaeraceae bacterium]|nr:glycosyltransferase family 2 protein [Phycisphaerae bacterium]MBX3393422.1 glycosyltransferase family 2 protein [Phycisphaeraceae bacterium]
MKTLVAIPVFNEAASVRKVLSRVLDYVGNVLVVDDGSTDPTPDIVREFPVDVIRHAVNRGYGRSVADAFRWAAADGYDWIITMDCDEQHEPDRIPDFLGEQERGGSDIISGSRYYSVQSRLTAQTQAPADRRRINGLITKEINERLATRLGTTLTDAFCGFKSHRVGAIADLGLTEDGYAFPMQLWVRAAAAGLRVRELPVELIYNNPRRTFGGELDNPEARLEHYRDVLARELAAHAEQLRDDPDPFSSACRGCGCQ